MAEIYEGNTPDILYIASVRPAINNCNCSWSMESLFPLYCFPPPLFRARYRDRETKNDAAACTEEGSEDAVMISSISSLFSSSNPFLLFRHARDDGQEIFSEQFAPLSLSFLLPYLLLLWPSSLRSETYGQWERITAAPSFFFFSLVVVVATNFFFPFFLRTNLAVDLSRNTRDRDMARGKTRSHVIFVFITGKANKNDILAVIWACTIVPSVL